MGITNILVSLSALILLPVLTKGLAIQDYGVWVQFTVTTAFIPFLVDLGLPYSMVRFLAVKKEKREIQEEFYSIAFLLLAMGLIASFVLFLFSRQIASILFNGNTTISLLLSFNVLLSIISASFFSYFRTFQQMKIVSILSVSQAYIAVVIIIFLLRSGYGVAGTIFGNFIVQIAVFLFAMVLVIHQIGFKFPKFENIREYLSFGLPIVPSNLSGWLVDLSDRYVIGLLLGTAFVGYYSPGYTLGNIIVMFMAPFTFLLPSLLSYYYDQNKIKEVEIHLQYSLKYFLLISIPAVFALSLLSKPLLTVLTTPAIAQNGYLITPFVALSAFLCGIYGIISQITVLEKKTKIIGYIWIVAAIINLSLNVIFVPLFGILVAAISTLIAYIFACAVIIFYSRHIKLKFDLEFTSKSLFASIVMSFVIIFINPTSFIGILITIFVCSGVYLFIIIFLRGISSNEIEFFKKLVKE